MDAKAFPAFGYVILKTKLKAGEVINDEMMQKNIFSIDNATPDVTGSISGSAGSYIWMLISGVHTYTNIITEDIDRHESGWCNLVNPLSVGMYKFDVVEDSEYICFSPIVNKDRSPPIPNLEYFYLDSGGSKELHAGTKLYLVDGLLYVNGNEIPSMRQIRIKNNKTKVTAIKKCLGYIFHI